MLNVVLHEPRIPPNTGNAIRLCANAGARLHLVGPLGFSLSEKAVRRAGLDYAELVDVRVHDSLDACFEALGVRADAGADGTGSAVRVRALTTRGRRTHAEADWRPGDVALFGAEPSGLPDAVLERADVHESLRIPMRPGVRSMNLSNAVAVVVYEAWRRNGFAGAGPGGPSGAPPGAT